MKPGKKQIIIPSTFRGIEMTQDEFFQQFKRLKIPEGWTIVYDPAPIPTDIMDYSYHHDNYDGEGSELCGRASSIQDAIDQINEKEITP